MARKGTILLVAVLVVSGIAWLAMTGSRRMPSYRGRPLDYWLSQMPVTLIIVYTNSGMTHTTIATASRVKFGPSSTTPEVHEQPGDCLLAMKVMGTNALPILLAKLRALDDPWKNQITRWAAKAGIKRVIFEPAVLTRGKAITGLEALQPLPESVQEQLRALSTNVNPNIAESAKYVLSGKPVDFGVGSTINSTTAVLRK